MSQKFCYHFVYYEIHLNAQALIALAHFETVHVLNNVVVNQRYINTIWYFNALDIGRDCI